MTRVMFNETNPFALETQSDERLDTALTDFITPQGFIQAIRDETAYKPFEIKTLLLVESPGATLKSGPLALWSDQDRYIHRCVVPPKQSNRCQRE